MKLDYNLFEALELRGKTLRQVGLADPEVCHPKHWDEVITFKISLEMTKGNRYWPEPPLVYEVLGNGEKVRSRSVTKKEWKTQYLSWRKYMRQCYLESEPGPSL